MGGLLENRAFWLGTWTVLNIVLTITNKNFYHFMSFPYPIAVSLVHMACSSTMAFLSLQSSGAKTRTLTMRDNVSMALLSFLFCANILVGNFCLKVTSVVLVQVTRSIVPGFTLLLSVWIMHSTFTLYQVLSIVIIILGLGLTSFGDVSVTTAGLALNVFGCILAALKGVLTSKFLKGFEPMELLFRLSSFSLFHLTVLLFITGEYKGVFNWISTSPQSGLQAAVVFFLNGFVAFFVNICNVKTTKLTSALTISIAGNVKQVLTVGFGIIVFNDHLSFVNSIGVMITFVGVFIYTWACHLKKKQEADKSSLKVSDANLLPVAMSVKG